MQQKINRLIESQKESLAKMKMNSNERLAIYMLELDKIVNNIEKEIDNQISIINTQNLLEQLENNKTEEEYNNYLDNMLEKTTHSNIKNLSCVVGKDIVLNWLYELFTQSEDNLKDLTTVIDLIEKYYKDTIC